jgi:hypothetical protein
MRFHRDVDDLNHLDCLHLATLVECLQPNLVGYAGAGPIGLDRLSAEWTRKMLLRHGRDRRRFLLYFAERMETVGERKISTALRARAYEAERQYLFLYLSRIAQALGQRKIAYALRSRAVQ